MLLFAAGAVGFAQSQSGGASSGGSAGASGSYSGESGGSGGTGSSSATFSVSAPPPPVGLNTYQGSVATQKVLPGVLSLSIQDAIALALRHNLGLILSGENVTQAGGQRLQQLQGLLPTATGSFRESEQQVDLQAQGLAIPGIPAVIGPYAYTDVRGYVNWSLVNISNLRNYLAAKHNFQSTKLSLEDARELVVLAAGSAYLRCIADEANIENDQAQVASSKVSLDQAVANHEAGTSARIDELRARVDYQTQQQTLISDQNAFDKDKIALARAIGLPLEQKFALTDQAPYAPLTGIDPQTALQEAYANRKDLRALQEQLKGAEASRASARAERYPSANFQGDYGDIGQTLAHSHGTFDAVGTASVPIFEEAKLRGDAQLAQAQLDQTRARLNDLKGQIDADVRDSFLDLQSAEKQLEVARSNVQLANESLVESQERFAAGVADNLPVTQALASLALANSQYVGSLYQDNLAKLELARALGVVVAKVKQYLGGK